MRSPQRILYVYPEPHFVHGGGISTYLGHAIRAHVEAGRDVHLLTWESASDEWFDTAVSDADLLPLRPDQVTRLRIEEADIKRLDPIGLRQKNISDILYPHIADAEKSFEPDLIESTDYCAPMHSYLERRRCGMHPDGVPVAIHNHGLLNDVWPATGLLPPEWTVRELALEFNVVRWADLIIAPSQIAAARISQMRRTSEGVHVVRAPFYPGRWTKHDTFDESRFAYFGRVSFAKGMDIFVDMLNAASGSWPISEIVFLGRRVPTPFRETNTISFLNARFSDDLRNKVRFYDSVPRSHVDNIVAHAGYFGNFSRSETFSYTTLEALSNGVVPLVLRSSPMSELLHPDVRNEGTFAAVPHREEDVIPVLTYWRDNYDHLIDICQQHAAELTQASRFTTDHERAVCSVPRKTPGVPAQHYRSKDVTILTPTHNDADMLEKAVRSVQAQTQPVAEILVLDDGSSEPDQIAKLDRMAEEGAIRLLRRRHMGLVPGRNVLVENARTSLVIFLDADDLLAPTYVEKTVTALNHDPGQYSAVFTKRQNFGANTDELTSILLDTPMHWVINDCRMNALIKRETLLEIPFDPAIRNGEADDWWWWLKFTLRGFKAVTVPETLFFYRSAPGSMSHPWSEGQAALTIELLKDAADEAAAREVDLLPILKAALAAAYANAREIDRLQGAWFHLPAHRSPAEADNLIGLRHIAKTLHWMLGPQKGDTVLDIARRLARSNAFFKWCAQAAIKGASRLIQRRAK